MAGNFLRVDGRSNADLRSIAIERNVSAHAEGSAIIKWGGTHVFCTASVVDEVPPFARARGGWVTAEYSMLPRSTGTRRPRDITKGKLDGRSGEIQRLIGRSLRSAFDLSRLCDRSIWFDCDVLQADGGTRTASITAAFVCAVDALRKINAIDALVRHIASVSVGIIDGDPMLDLCYAEDSRADVDCNIVKASSGGYVELQGTGEGAIFSRSEHDAMLDLADAGLEKIFSIQKEALDLSAGEKARFADLAKGSRR